MIKWGQIVPREYWRGGLPQTASPDGGGNGGLEQREAGHSDGILLPGDRKRDKPVDFKRVRNR